MRRSGSGGFLRAGPLTGSRETLGVWMMEPDQSSSFPTLARTPAMVAAMEPADRAQVSPDSARAAGPGDGRSRSLGLWVSSGPAGDRRGRWHRGRSGRPADGSVEIAYGIDAEYRGRVRRPKLPRVDPLCPRERAGDDRVCSHAPGAERFDPRSDEVRVSEDRGRDGSRGWAGLEVGVCAGRGGVMWRWDRSGRVGRGLRTFETGREGTHARAPGPGRGRPGRRERFDEERFKPQRTLEADDRASQTGARCSRAALSQSLQGRAT